MGLYGKSISDYPAPEPERSPTPTKRVNAGKVTLGFLSSLKDKAKSYLDKDKNGKVSLGEVGSAAKKLPGQAYDTAIKPTVKLAKDAVSDVVYDIPKSIIKNVQAKTNAERAKNNEELQKNTVIGKITQPIKDNPTNPGKAARQTAGKTAETVLDALPFQGLGTKQAIKLALKSGGKKALVASVKQGAKEGAVFNGARSAATTAQEDAPTLMDYVKNIGTGIAGGAAMGAAGSGVITLGVKGASKALNKAAGAGIDNATRSAMLRELTAAGEKKAAGAVKTAQTPQDVLAAVEGTRFHPDAEKVKVAPEKQAIDPAKGGVETKMGTKIEPKTPDGRPIDPTTGEILDKPELGKGPAEQIAILEDQLKNHPKAEAMEISRTRDVANKMGANNDQYKQILEGRIKQLDDHAAFADTSNQVELSTKPEKVSSSDQVVNKIESKPEAKPNEVSLLDQNAKNAQADITAKQEQAAIRGGGLAKAELPGMEKYRQRAAQYKKNQAQENAMLDEKYAPAPSEIAAADRNATDSVSLLNKNDTKPAASILSEPKVNLDESVADIPSVRHANTPNEAAEIRDAGVKAVNGTVDQIAAAVRAKGVSPEDFFKMIDNGKVPAKLQGEFELHKKLLKDIRNFSEQSYGDIGEHYVPHQDPAKQKLETSNMFDTSFDFSKHRTGALKDYSHDYVKVMGNLGVQAADAKARLFQMAKDKGVTVDKILDDQKVARDLAAAAKKDQLGKLGLADRLYQNDVAEAKRTGADLPERAIVTETLDKFTRYLRDGWTGLKRTGVWNDVFEPLSRASERASYNYETLVKPALSSIDDTMAAIEKVGIKEPQRLAMIQRDLLGLRDDAVEPFLHKLLYSYEKSEGQIKLTDWLRTHEITDPTLKELVNKHAEYMLARDAVVPDLARKLTNFVTGRVYKAALGLNVRSTMNQLLEGKRTLARHGAAGAKYLVQAASSNEYRKKYGIEDTSIEQQLNLIKGKDSKLYEALKSLDDKQMYFFMKGEGFKNEVMLRAGEADGAKKGLEGDALFKHTMDYFEKYAHVYGHLGTVGIYDNNLVKLLGQFGQYAIKDLALTGDMAAKVIGKGSKDTTTRREALAYLTRLTAINTGLLTVMSAAIGSTWQEVFGGPSLNGGPLVTLVSDLYTGVQDEMANAQQEGRGFDVGKAVSRSSKRAVAGTLIPSGNQLINKTGVQAYLPDDNGVKKFFTDGALMDMERGYNASAKGRARFLAPKGGDDAAKAVAFGPYSTQESQDYFKNGGKALGEKQTQQLNAAPDQQATYNDIIKEREQTAADKKLKAEAKAAGTVDYGKVKPALKQVSFKPKKATGARKVRSGIKISVKKTRLKKARKPVKVKKIKLGIKT